MSERLRLLVGQLTVAVFLTALALPMLDLSWTDDFACGSAQLGPRHGGDQFETAKASPLAEHCAICHWMHAVTGARPRAVVAVAVTIGTAVRCPVAPAPRSGQTFSSQGPSRAPPASALL